MILKNHSPVRSLPHPNYHSTNKPGKKSSAQYSANTSKVHPFCKARMVAYRDTAHCEKKVVAQAGIPDTTSAPDFLSFRKTTSRPHQSQSHSYSSDTA
jgi:hypothetical protein